MPSSMSAEISAMAQLEAALADLQDDQRDRVLRWAAARFAVQIHSAAANTAVEPAAPATESVRGGEEYDDFASFYDAASPSSDTEKALVATYWLQVHAGSADVDTQTANTELKHLGHGIGNITRAFDHLKGQRPALVVQTRKEGSSQQARKKFKITSEGKKAITRMLRGETGT